jgi:hypothetical protein
MTFLLRVGKLVPIAPVNAKGLIKLTEPDKSPNPFSKNIPVD